MKTIPAKWECVLGHLIQTHKGKMCGVSQAWPRGHISGAGEAAVLTALDLELEHDRHEGSLMIPLNRK